MKRTSPSLQIIKPAVAATLAVVIMCGLSVRPAQAGYIVTLQQVGSDVVATGSGTLDTTGLAINIEPPFAPGLMQPDAGAITTGPTGFASDSQRAGNLVSGPASFGSGGQTLASSGSGDTVGFAVGQPLFTLIVPQNCMFSSSCGPLSDSSTYAGATFASLGITPGTYEWRWGTGSDQNFTIRAGSTGPTPTPTPGVTTNPATTVASFSATLNGSLNPRGETTTVEFQYGPTTSYGHTTPVQTQTGNTTRLISANISGLTASTTYHFRIVAHDNGGTSFGSDRTFTTLGVTGPPVVITSPATLLASFSATLNGSVDPHGLTTSVHFQYGTTTSYGLTTAPQSHTGNTYLNVSGNISGLLASHVYHFRIVATNSAGTTFGGDRTFTTLSATGTPVVTTNPATNVTSSSATLNGSLDPHGLTTSVHFQYGTTTSYGSTTPMQSHTGNTYLNISANISGLSASHVYHFRIVATNSAGTKVGSDKTFTTP